MSTKKAIGALDPSGMVGSTYGRNPVARLAAETSHDQPARLRQEPIST